MPIIHFFPISIFLGFKKASQEDVYAKPKIRKLYLSLMEYVHFILRMEVPTSIISDHKFITISKH